MRSNAQVARRFRRATLQQQVVTEVCQTCGALVTWEGRSRHDAFHVLIEGMDETLNLITGSNGTQDELPF